MIKIPYADMISRIKEKSGLSEEDINKKIDDKLEQLAGLISKDGAANIVANELGIKLFEGRAKVKDIYPGMKGIEVVGRVQQIAEAKDFTRNDGTLGKVGSFTLADETGTIRVVCWGEQTEVIGTLVENSVVKLVNTSVRENNRGFREIHLNELSRVVLDPPNEILGEVKQAKALRKRINELAEQDENVEILGTIVQVFDLKFFETCPECGIRMKSFEGSFTCEKHGSIKNSYSYLLNFFLDDGTESIRCVLFKNQAERLLNKTSEEMLAFRNELESFEQVKHDLLGSMVKMVGRAKKNTFFDRLEFIAQLVYQADPKEELERLKEEG